MDSGFGSLFKGNQPIASHFLGSFILGLLPDFNFAKKVVGTQC